MMPSDSLLDALHGLVGQRGLLLGDDARPYCTDWRSLYHGHTPAVVRPGDTAELASVMQLCAARNVPVVPQGGNTGLVGGAVPSEAGDTLVISLQRMNRVRAVDPLDLTLTVEAGITLKAAQDAAAAADCLLPLSISSEGSATIGGVLSTNAGGNTTLRHGNARSQVLGLEVVLADGQVWNGLRRLRKDNTGYCLRQLFVGAEGTLGLITAAVLQLQPAIVESESAFCAVPDPASALELLRRVRRQDPAALTAFEYMSGVGVDLVLRHIQGARLPLPVRAAHYVLLELTTSRHKAGLREQLETVLGRAMEDGVVLDAALADTGAQRDALWSLREEHAEAQKRAGASVKNDISVPISAIPDFLARVGAAIVALDPAIRPAPFGHFGDGNIHYNLIQPEGGDGEAFLARADEMATVVNAVARALDGSFSAEHGVGRLKAGLMTQWRGGPELDTMRRIKEALDPAGLLSPGTLFHVPMPQVGLTVT